MNLSKILAAVAMTAALSSAGFAADAPKADESAKKSEVVKLEDTPKPVKERIDKESKGYELVSVTKEMDDKGKSVYVAKIKKVTVKGEMKMTTTDNVYINEAGNIVDTKQELPELPKLK
jgi:hypothetical protein